MIDPQTVTLSQEDYKALKELSDLTVKMANGDTRKEFARIAKKVDPKRRFPDVEAEDLEDRINKKFEEREQQEIAAKAAKKLERAKAKLKESYDDKAIEEIEGIMEKHGIADYEVGAKLYAADTKPATPSSIQQDHRFTLPNIDIKDFGNLRQIQQSRAYQAIDDIKRNRR